MENISKSLYKYSNDKLSIDLELIKDNNKIYASKVRGNICIKKHNLSFTLPEQIINITQKHVDKYNNIKSIDYYNKNDILFKLQRKVQFLNTSYISPVDSVEYNIPKVKEIIYYFEITEDIECRCIYSFEKDELQCLVYKFNEDSDNESFRIVCK